MNVSLSRKIHIIALPQGTGNACLSADQSVDDLLQPAGQSGGVIVPSVAIAARILC